MLDHTFDYAHI